jgi:hypothetical protein
MLPQRCKIFNDVFLLINFTRCNYLLIAETHVGTTLQKLVTMYFSDNYTKVKLYQGSA